MDIADIRKELLRIGFESNGNELLYNGLTGEQLESNIFIGPVFYQRLKHMVSDKAHSRSIGPMVNLTRQPAEGRSRDGGLRFGEMERDCLIGLAPVPLSCGLSVAIENMGSCNFDVLGWSDTHNGVVKAKQTDFMYKGERDCFEITMEDGRKLSCTGDHPLLTSDKTWVKAKDLVIGQSKLKVSVTCPLMNIEEEMNECAGWKLKVDTVTLSTDTPENFMKTLAFARIIGLLITDGHISNIQCSGCVYLGHTLDVESFLNDLALFTTITQTTFKEPTKNYYKILIPIKFLKNIITLPGLIFGRKIVQPAILPEFVVDPSCPRPIVREFLAGMFGGDGHTCHLGLHRGKRDLLTSVSLSISKIPEHMESLKTMFNTIIVLFNKCGINTITIQNFKENTSSKKKTNIQQSERKYQLTLHLDMSELIPFSEKVGFRYCCHKSQRLEAAVSYRRLRQEVTRQHNWIVNRVDEITNFSELKKQNPAKNVPTKKAIVQAVEELSAREPILHSYVIPSTHDITDHLIKGTQFGKFTSTFPTAEQFLEKVGALSWFLEDKQEDKPQQECTSDDETVDTSKVAYGVARENCAIPAMDFTVLSCIPIGPKKVYDISVADVHSFLANGIVAHNCMVSHGASRFTRGRMYDSSDKYQVNVCKKCGLIAAYNNTLHIHECHTCNNRSDFAYLEIPYACKLLFQELITMNVAPRIITEH